MATTRQICCGRSGAGFTLIEMLVVVLIMGLLVALVSVVARPDERGQLKVEAERLAQLLELAVAESRSTGKPLGWTASGPTYQFWRFAEDTGWVEVRDSDLLRERVLPPGMIVAGLSVENMRPRGALRLEFTPDAPPLFFSIELSMGEERYAVASSMGGRVRAVAAGEQANVPAI